VILEPREHVSRTWVVLSPIAAGVAALLVGTILIAWAGAPIAGAYGALVDGAVGSRFALLETLVTATPLILTGVCVAVAFQARFYNIGAEGQLYAGALVATGLAGGFLDWPAYVLLPVVLAGSFLAGGLLLSGPALLKTQLGVDEVVTTLLLNFIMLLVVDMVVLGPWKDPLLTNSSFKVLDAAELPQLVSSSRLHWGLVIAVAIAIVVWVVMRRTALGYEIKAVGSNARAARFTGISTLRTILVTALISGGLAGVAGGVQLLGLNHALSTKLSSGFGYAGIVVALLARLDPLGVIGAAVFFAAISTGADNLSREFEIPIYLSEVIQALSLLFMLVALLLVRYRIRRG
jgi:simple sugar transport system permease protein